MKVNENKINFEKTIIDLGTGDGRFIYKNAKKHPENLYIGIDPALKQTKEFQKKINRERLRNAIFYSAAVENLPKDLTEKADEVYINFPWGSLLAGIANADKTIIDNIVGLLKDKGSLEIIFGYSSDAEPSEFERLSLVEISEDTLNQTIIPGFEKTELKLTFLETLTRDDIFKIETNWAKKLTFGQDRKIFRLTFTKK